MISTLRVIFGADRARACITVYALMPVSITWVDICLYPQPFVECQPIVMRCKGK